MYNRAKGRRKKLEGNILVVGTRKERLIKAIMEERMKWRRGWIRKGVKRDDKSGEGETKN